jgi:hypothetical protein
MKPRLRLTPCNFPGAILMVALLAAGTAAASPTVSFMKRVIAPRFFAESIAVADCNRDGKPDLIVGPYWIPGPEFTKKIETRAALAYDRESYSDAFVAAALDVDGDGWTDAIQVGWPGRAALWFKNPGKAGGDWPRHVLHDSVGTESPELVELIAGQPPALIFATDKKLGYAAVDRAHPAAPWAFHAISVEGEWQRYTHGLGAGDINGDGRADLLCYKGWWEQPASLAGDPVWKFHAANFGDGGAQMYATDVNGDGRADVITSIEAHQYGLSWFEQLAPAASAAESTWREHVILSRHPAEKINEVQFSQPHATVLADIDGDGLLDIVTGKRHWAHGSAGDPEPNAPAVLYWFRLVRDPVTHAASYEPHLIDSDSGVGTKFVVTDLNGDGFPDVAVANKHGVFAFLQRRTP